MTYTCCPHVGPAVIWSRASLSAVHSVKEVSYCHDTPGPKGGIHTDADLYYPSRLFWYANRGGSYRAIETRCYKLSDLPHLPSLLIRLDLGAVVPERGRKYKNGADMGTNKWGKLGPKRRQGIFDSQSIRPASLDPCYHQQGPQPVEY